jgi:hypothetical protein
MGVTVLDLGIQKERGYLYYIDPRRHAVMRVKAARRTEQSPRGTATVVVQLPADFKLDYTRYIYYITKTGGIGQAQRKSRSKAA